MNTIVLHVKYKNAGNEFVCNACGIFIAVKTRYVRVAFRHQNSVEFTQKFHQKCWDKHSDNRDARRNPVPAEDPPMKFSVDSDGIHLPVWGRMTTFQSFDHLNNSNELSKELSGKPVVPKNWDIPL